MGGHWQMSSFAAVVLAGGAARRMGGAPKPSLPVGGVSMLTRVLGAVAAAWPRVVVGPLELVASLPRRVSMTTEHPAGGGPVAAMVAGLGLLGRSPDTVEVAVLAADLPFLGPGTIDALRQAADRPGLDGAVLVDDDGRPQWLCGVWRLGALRAALPSEPAGLGMRQLLGGLAFAEVAEAVEGPPAWFDCDTDEDLRQAEEWTRRG